ncbi:MAG: gluconolaconase [Proteobacteria bacterium]|nr:gluconolaconase [Pseudomonadota bacterium]
MRAFHHSLLLSAAWLCIVPASAETLLVVRKTDNAVNFIDPGSGLRLASVLTGNAPHEISVSPDGKHAVVSNYGTREQPGSTLSVVDLEQPREIRRIDLAPNTRPHGLAWYAPDRIAVTTEGSRHLLILDPAGGRIVGMIETAQETSHMVVASADARRAYVTNIGSGTTTAIDLVDRRKLRDIATGAGSEALALTQDGHELWVAARTDGHVAVVDTATLVVKARLPLTGIPIRIAMARDGRTALVTCAGAAEIVAFDVETRVERRRAKVTAPLAPGAPERPFARMAPGSVLPVGLLVSRDGRSAYVAATMGDRVVQFDTRTLEVLRSLDVGGEPDGLGSTPVIPRRVPRLQAAGESAVGPAAAQQVQSLSTFTIEASAVRVGPSVCQIRRGDRSCPAAPRSLTWYASRPLW